MALPVSLSDPCFEHAGRSLARGRDMDFRAYGPDDYAQELRLAFWRASKASENPRYRASAFGRTYRGLQRDAVRARSERQRGGGDAGVLDMPLGYDTEARMEARNALDVLRARLPPLLYRFLSAAGDSQEFQQQSRTSAYRNLNAARRQAAAILQE